MSERGFACTNSCYFRVHGVCHMEYCPRLDQAYALLQKCLELYDDFSDPECEEIRNKIESFLKEDESWDPECLRRQQENERKSLQCNPKTCKSGLTMCASFMRTGDDYGNCLKSGQSCPHDGFVDVSQLEVK